MQSFTEHNNRQIEHNEKLYAEIKSSALNDAFLQPVALRNRKSTFPIIPVHDAQEMIYKEIIPIGQEFIFLQDALGRILVEDVFVNHPLPPFRASIKGLCSNRKVRVENVPGTFSQFAQLIPCSDDTGERKVLGTVHAGELANSKLLPGYCVRVTTGAPVPGEADAVVQVEDTELLDYDKQVKQ